MNASWSAYLPDLREWLEGKERLQATVANAGWLLLDRVLRMAIGVTVGAWVARYLGPSQFGTLSYVVSFLAFFQVVARMEADGFVVRDLAQERADPAVILGTALWLRLFFALFSWVAALLAVFLLHPQERGLLLLTAVVGASMLFHSSDLVDSWFQSRGENKRTVLAKLASYLFSNGIRVALLLMKAPLIAFAGVITLEAAALAVSLVVTYRRLPTATPWRGSLAQAKSLLGQCWPLLLSGVMVTVYLRIDQIMLKEMLGERQLGIYAAALPVSQVLSTIPSVLLTTLWPYVSQKKKESEQAYQEVLVKMFRLFAIVALAGAAFISLISPWIIELLYGSEYRASAPILSIHVFANLFIFQNLAQNLWAVNDDGQRTALLSSLVAAVVSIVANAVLIREIGTAGAAISMVLTEFVSAAMLCLLRRDLLTLYRRAFFLQPVRRLPSGGR